MRIAFPLGVLALACVPAFAQVPDVGSGSPTESIRASFINAFYRAGFQNLVNLPPLGDVRAFGATGLVQEFGDSARNKYALLMPDSTMPIRQDTLYVYQLIPALYTYYLTFGVTTAGYPMTDTTPCPPILSFPSACQYQLFNKPYGLFVYTNGLGTTGTNFATRDPFYTKWNTLGGIATLGPAVGVEQAVTSPAATKATIQTFDRGAVFNITSGVLTGRILAVSSVIFSLYAANQGYLGQLGFPTADETTLSTGRHRQTFEGGTIEYDPGSAPVLKFPVHDVLIGAGISKLTLAVGDTANLQATTLDSSGNILTDRTIIWSTSNSRVVTIASSGASATIKAVAGGSANITATSEGKLSIPLPVLVTSTCCDIGEGSPTPAIQQEFRDAVARNHLNLTFPISTPALRIGTGFVQDAQDAANGTDYSIAVPDGAGTGYVVGGALLGKYRTLGSVTGSLGYPSSDVTAGGRQMFAGNAALAGNPVYLVTGNFLTKWAALKYETGAAGSPVSDPMNVLTFRATLGATQSFSNGLMASAQNGSKAGAVYFVRGPVLAAYLSANAATGSMGLPVSDETSVAGKFRQDFEGGYIDYSPGDSIGQLHPGNRTPAVTATPASVLPGARLRLAAGGFNSGSTLRISISGQSDFLVKTENGAYSWETTIPANASPGVVSIHAADTSGSSADGAYTVRAAADVRFQLAKISGDGQNGLPGALLPQPLKIALQDDQGNPVAGAPVQFSASPGAQIVSASATTDLNGQAQASVRLPAGDGIALVTAQTERQTVTFGLQATHSSLANFPKQSQGADVPLGNAALLASASAIIRYYQNRGDLPAPNGFADPQALNQFLKAFCVLDPAGRQICDGFLNVSDSHEQIVNLWRLASFCGNALDVEVQNPDQNHIRDLLAGGSPVLLALSLTPSGSHYVVAIGEAADGSVLIMDPNPAFGKSNLNDYLSGFGGVKATIAAAVQLIPQVAVSHGFLVVGQPVFDISSVAGTCGLNLDLPASSSIFRVRFCEGAQSLYQLDIITSGAFALTLTDLGNPGNRVDLSGNGTVSYKISRSGVQWTAIPQSLSFSANSALNAASFTPDLSPGALFSVFGSGMAGPNVKTSVQIAGLPAPVIAQTPFQVNGQIPADLAPGTYTIKLSSPYGAAEQPIQIAAVSPGIFQVTDQIAAILNENGTLNTPNNPARRGQVIVVFCTGLGTVTSQGNLKVAQVPATGLVQGVKWTAAFAGLSPGFIGLYQVNLPIPAATPPGLNLSLAIQQGNFTSNTVQVSIQ
ncbi:MAG TPA: Ig-like domain-containing protein [Bryobacteraceae bacterium]